MSTINVQHISNGMRTRGTEHSRMVKCSSELGEPAREALTAAGCASRIRAMVGTSLASGSVAMSEVRRSYLNIGKYR